MKLKHPLFVAALLLLVLPPAARAAATDDVVFIHGPCGASWLADSLQAALAGKTYIDEVNDISAGTDVPPDPNRLDALAPTPGDNTNMNHWIRWFNDYLAGVKAHGCATGVNRIVLFMSDPPASNITSDGHAPGDPFAAAQTYANYQAVFRHADGPGNYYADALYRYWPLEDVFFSNPDTLFIFITAPPRHYAPADATTDAEAHRARLFNNWVKLSWLAYYKFRHRGLNNVAVFDLFDVLAYPDDDPEHPNRLRAEYGGASGASDPNADALTHATELFATAAGNAIDEAWALFTDRQAFHVDVANTTGIEDGTPAHPFNTIKEAIYAATHGDTFKVAQGTYTSADAEVVSIISGAVFLLGGYVGSPDYATTPGDFSEATRDWTAHPSVIDGQNVRRCVLLDGAAVEISGFCLTRGKTTEDGGGLYSTYSTVTLSHVTFIANEADKYGGGMQASHGHLTLSDVTFTGNHARYGGGLETLRCESLTLDRVVFSGNEATYYGGGMRDQNSRMTLTHITFNDNQALDGGGLYALMTRAAPITHSTFSRNSASRGGGLYVDIYPMTLSDVTFSDNQASSRGGGMYGDSVETLTRVVFTGNHATLDGGGLYGGDTLTDCLFTNNEAGCLGGGAYGGRTVSACDFIGNTAGENGGGMHGGDTITGCRFTNNAAGVDGGGMVCSGTITDCLFTSNTAAEGGGGLYGSGTITDCVFTSNVAGGDGGGILLGSYATTLAGVAFTGNRADRGGGMYQPESRYLVSVAHAVFSGNRAGASAGAVYIETSAWVDLVNSILWANEAPTDPEIHLEDTSDLDVSYSDVQGGFPGTGNLDIAPLFADPGHWDDNATPGDPEDDTWVDGDYHLKSTNGRYNPSTGLWEIDAEHSPCIDAADPLSPYDAEPLPNGLRANMGAYGGTDEASKSSAVWTLQVLSPEPADRGATDPATGCYTCDVGTDVVVVASPMEGWRVDHWEINGVPAGSGVELTVPSGAQGETKSVQVLFVRATWTLEVLDPEPLEGGTTTPGPGTTICYVGTDATVAASPVDRWKLDHWEVDGAPAGSGDPLSVPSGGDGKTRTVQAFFVRQAWTLEVLDPDPVEGGTTTPGPGSIPYYVGTDATVTAKPHTEIGWTLDHWEMDGADAGSDNPITVSSAADDETTTLQAVFVHDGRRVLAAGHTSGIKGSTVEVPISIVDGSDVVAIDLTITWDAGILDLVEVLKGAITGDWTLTTSPAAGSVIVSLSHSEPLPTEGGDVLTLRFEITGVQRFSAVAFVSISVNGGTMPVSGIDGSVTVMGFNLGGTVAYFGGAQNGVTDVTLALSGDHFEVATTDVAGGYAFPMVPPVDVTCTPSRASESVPRGLSSYDAAKVAQAALGMITPSAQEQTAGDVSGTGTLSDQDAEAIAQRVVGLTGSFPVSDFLFAPEGRSYEPLDADQTDQDFVMVRAGDYTGSWTLPAGDGGTSTAGGGLLATPAGRADTAISVERRGRPPCLPSSLMWARAGGRASIFAMNDAAVQGKAAAGSADPLAVRTVRIHMLSVAPGGTVRVPVSINDAADIIGYDFTFSYNPLVVRPLAVTKTAFTDGFTVTSRIIEAEARVIVSLFGTQPLTGPGELVNIEIGAVASGHDVSMLLFENILLNEGEVPAYPSDGAVYVTGSLMLACVDDSNTTGVEDGSEAHPFDAIYEGVSAVLEGGTVKVAQGTYTSGSNPVVFVTYARLPAVFLRGGYVGASDYLSGPGNFADANRDWEINVTTIDGEDARRCVTLEVYEGELSGFHLTRGYDRYVGAGIYLHSGTAVICDNVISDCVAQATGGGIEVRALDPGGSEAPTIVRNTIRGNSVLGDYGGAGICCTINTSPTICNNIITGNSALGTLGGGGIGCYRTTNATITRNIITGNWAETKGGGISCLRTCATVSHNVISDNSTDGAGGGIYVEDDSVVPVESNLVAGNTAAADGGAVFIDASAATTIVNNTIVGNSAPTTGGIAGDSNAAVNCILWGNTGGDLSGCTATYSCIEDGDAGTGNISANPLFAGVNDGRGPDNIAGTDDDDYHLRSITGRYDPSTGLWEIDAEHSPCIDAGDPLSLYDAEPLPNGSRVNTGAYGGTEEASKSSAVWTLQVLAPDPTEGGTTVPGPGTHACEVGIDATVSADPALGWKLDGWEIDGVPAGSDAELTVPAGGEGETRTVQAFFVRATWALEVLDPDPLEGGMTTPGPGSIPCYVGTDATVTASAGPEWRLDHWQLDGADAGSENPITVPSAADGETVTLQAVFVHHGPRLLAAGHTSGTIGSTVEVPISIDDGTDAVSIDLTITWDAGMLDFVEALKGAITGDWTLTTSPAVGSVAVSLSHSAALPAEGGEVARLRFQIIGGHTVSPVAFASISLNEGAVAASGIDGSVTVTGFALGGTVAYFGGAQGGVPDVAMTLSGGYSDVVTTDAAGGYTFLTVPPEDITCTPSRAPENPPGGLSSYDAAKVAQAVVGIIAPNAYEETAGDVTGNGSLSSLDAARIAQRVVRVIDSFPVSDFLFVPEDRSYEPLDADQADQDFVMIRAGDYTGNWTPPAGGGGTSEAPVARSSNSDSAMTAERRGRPPCLPSSPSRAGAGARSYILANATARGGRAAAGTTPLLARTVSIPTDLTVAPGATVQAPVSIDDAADIIGYDFVVTYDPLVVRPLAVTRTAFTDAFTLTPRIIEAEAKVIVSLFSTQSLTGSGVLVNIEFEAVGSAGEDSPLVLGNVLLNEGEVPATPMDGLVSIAGAVTADLTATVQLEGYTGSPGTVLTLRFVLSDGDEVPLDTREVDVAFTNGSDTEVVVLTDVPPDTAWVSCKEAGHFLRRRVAAGGAAPALTAGFTGGNQLIGGDLNDDNFVELRDFAQFLRDFGRPDCPESDINGDGDVDNSEFGYIGLHFFQMGDPE